MLTVAGKKYSGTGAVAAALPVPGNGRRLAAYFASNGVLSANTLNVDRVTPEGNRYRLFSHNFATTNAQYVSLDDYWTLLQGDQVEAALSAGGTWTLELIVSAD